MGLSLLKRFMHFFKRHPDVGVLVLRLFVSVRLLYGVLDNITSWSRMLEFKDFLQLFHFPMPLVSAVVSVYAQAIAAVLIGVGWKIRWAAVLMIVNFAVALMVVHRGQSFEQLTPPLALLFTNILFLFTGAGRYSADLEPLGSFTHYGSGSCKSA
jgi:putative oxidoreductase